MNTSIATMGQSLTIEEMKSQVQQIQLVMKELMKEGEHFGVIPGTKKATLLKPGAEKLCLTFRLAPSYEIERRQLQGDHVEYIITGTLTHINTGHVWGQGVGSCSTMETKYRYRNSKESTGKLVPREYWDMRDVDAKKAQDLIGGKGFATVKNDDTGGWEIAKVNKGENPDLADTWNTILKMAKKRALVDATLTATAASDIFTQDLDDNAKPAEKDVTPKAKTEPAAKKKANGISDAQMATIKSFPPDIAGHLGAKKKTPVQMLHLHKDFNGHWNNMRKHFGLPQMIDDTSSPSEEELFNREMDNSLAAGAGDTHDG